jgi:hypothetical protein
MELPVGLMIKPISKHKGWVASALSV